MAAPPTLAVLHLDGPFYVRKLQRRSSWGEAATPVEQRVQAVFLRDVSPYSLYLVGSDEDLKRVTMGINGGRSSLTEDVNYLPILPAEFESAGIEVNKSPGDTRCRIANDLHYDFSADEEQLIRLCQTIVDANRLILPLKRNQLAPWSQQTKDDGCLSFRESTKCNAAACWSD
jgi:hypothetical protein